MTTSDMERVTLRIPTDDIEEIDEHVDAGRYPNRSEAIRQAIDDLLADHRDRPVLADGGER